MATVKCTSNNKGKIALTVGKSYNIVSTGITTYKVKNDKGVESAYLKTHFAAPVGDVKAAPAPVAPKGAPAPVAKPVAAPAPAKKNDSYFVAFLGSDDDPSTADTASFSNASIISASTAKELEDALMELRDSDELDDDDNIIIYSVTKVKDVNVVLKPTIETK